MSATIVCDASVIVALLLDSGQDGAWSVNALTGSHLAAPTLMRFEAANIIRRHELSQSISPDQAAQAHVDLLDLAIQEWPYEALAARGWQLRYNLTSYDASYVALAEFLNTTLATLDSRLARSPGLPCAVATP